MTLLEFDPDESNEGIMWGKIRGMGFLFDKSHKRIGIVYFNGQNKFIGILNKDLIFISEKVISTRGTVNGVRITNNNLMIDVID